MWSEEGGRRGRKETRREKGMETEEIHNYPINKTYKEENNSVLLQQTRHC